MSGNMTNVAKAFAGIAALAAVGGLALGGCSADIKPDSFGLTVFSPPADGDLGQTFMAASLSWDLHESQRPKVDELAGRLGAPR